MHYEILLVDDEKSVTKALNRLLRHEFSVVHQAQSAAEALTILANNTIDMVIADYYMPEVNGADLLSEIHIRYPDVLNLMLSGQADMQGFSKALNDGSISKFICKPWNNEQLKSFILEAIKEFESQKIQDTLTKLPTLKMFTEQIKHLGLSEFNGACVALLNINDFSTINEKHGLQVGNKLLKELAKRINIIFPDNLIARVKDDLFAVVLQDEANVSKDTHTLLRIISTSITVDSFEVQISGSVGITTIDDWKINQTENLARNLHQMNTLSTDNQRVIFCDSDKHDNWFKSAILISELQHAIKTNELSLYYQPQVDLSSLRVTGCEALLRWFHPQKGLLTPDEFIPYIERYNMGDSLLEMILDQTFQFMSTETDIFTHIRMSINLFASQLGNPKLTTLILDKLKVYQISPQSLELEITETSLIKNFQETRDQLTTLRNAGIKIAIDDFGTGYASYEYLCELPVDVVKIDGCFIKGMYHSLERSTALTNIIATATTLSLEIVAECVESEKQAKSLTEMGCNRLQGYFFSKPLSGEDFINFTLLYNTVDIKLRHKKNLYDR